MHTTALLVVGVLGACYNKHAEVIAIPPETDDGLARSIREANQRMHDRYVWAAQIQRQLPRGDLDLVHASARVITRLEEPSAPPSWQPYLASVRDAARQIELAKDPILAARSVGALGQRCAECHEAMHANVQLPSSPLPAHGPALASQMLDHQWAAAQMWDGLIGPAPERWTRGAEALATMPLNVVAQVMTPSYDGDVDDIQRVRALAREAMTTKTTAERGELYGRLLGACVHCHTIVRDH